MVFKVLGNQCLQGCSFTGCTHRCNEGKRPCRPPNTDRCSCRHYWCCKTLYLVSEAVCPDSESKTTHEIVKVHVPNAQVFFFNIYFSPIQLFQAPLSKSCLKAFIHGQPRSQWCREMWGLPKRDGFWQVFECFGVDVYYKVVKKKRV